MSETRFEQGKVVMHTFFGEASWRSRAVGPQQLLLFFPAWPLK